MKNVIQGDSINLEVTFYNVDPSMGGIPTDPDNYLHTWEIQNDVENYISGIVLLEGGSWPAQTIFYLTLFDYVDGMAFEVKGFSDAGRTIEIVTTGVLPYGVFVAQALNEVGGSGF